MTEDALHDSGVVGKGCAVHIPENVQRLVHKYFPGSLSAIAMVAYFVVVDGKPTCNTTVSEYAGIKWDQVQGLMRKLRDAGVIRRKRLGKKFYTVEVK